MEITSIDANAVMVQFEGKKKKTKTIRARKHFFSACIEHNLGLKKFLSFGLK